MLGSTVNDQAILPGAGSVSPAPPSVMGRDRKTGAAGSYWLAPVRSRDQRHETEPPGLETSKRIVTVSPTVRVNGAVRPSTVTAVTACAGVWARQASSAMPGSSVRPVLAVSRASVLGPATRESRWFIMVPSRVPGAIRLRVGDVPA